MVDWAIALFAVVLVPLRLEGHWMRSNHGGDPLLAAYSGAGINDSAALEKEMDNLGGEKVERRFLAVFLYAYMCACVCVCA